MPLLFSASQHSSFIQAFQSFALSLQNLCLNIKAHTIGRFRETVVTAFSLNAEQIYQKFPAWSKGRFQWDRPLFLSNKPWIILQRLNADIHNCCCHFKPRNGCTNLRQVSRELIQDHYKQRHRRVHTSSGLRGLADTQTSDSNYQKKPLQIRTANTSSADDCSKSGDHHVWWIWLEKLSIYSFGELKNGLVQILEIPHEHAGA